MRAASLGIVALASAASRAPAKVDTKAGDDPTFAAHLRGAKTAKGSGDSDGDAAPAKPADPATPAKPDLATLLDSAATQAAAQTATQPQVVAQLAQILPVVTELVQRTMAQVATVHAEPAPASSDESAQPPALSALPTPPTAAPGSSPDAEPPATPLEQAVHDLLDQLAPNAKPRSSSEAPTAQVSFGHALITASTHDAAPDLAAPATPLAPARGMSAPQPPPDAPSNPSHVHLVVEDGDQRVVVTVAVRGDEVRVAMRTSDDTLAAGLARNAGALDHALRARGLDLQDFTAERDPDARGDRRDPPPQRDRGKHERFTLEEQS